MLKQKERLRRSVSLEPQAKAEVERIAEEKGVTVNRAIEQAVRFHSQCLRVESREQGEIVGFLVQAPDGTVKTVHVITS